MPIKRRNFLIAGSAAGLSACSPKLNRDYTSLDRRSLEVRNQMFANFPETYQISNAAAGYLIFPKLHKAALIYGGSFGEATMFTRNNITGHYRLSALSYGLQAGYQNLSMALFFIGRENLANFRQSLGFEFGADIEYAIPTFDAASFGNSSQTFNRPVYALIFNQNGLIGGISLEGAKYTQI